MKTRGFTLIEMLITIALIALLSAIALFGLQGVREQGRDAKRKSDLESIRSGLETYRADCNLYPSRGTGAGQLNITTPPATLTGSGNPAATCPAANRYIEAVPNDPQSPTRVYYYNPTNGNATYDLCARLENAPSPAMNMGTCGNNCGGACNYRVTSP